MTKAQEALLSGQKKGKLFTLKILIIFGVNLPKNADKAIYMPQKSPTY